MTTELLNEWRFYWYSKRLETETRPEHIRYLLNELKQLENGNPF